MSLPDGNLSGRMTQGERGMMAVRWRGILGRPDDGVAPGKGYRDFVSCSGILVSEFPLTYRDELIDEVSVWGGKGRRDCLDLLTTTLYMSYNPITQPST
jgi:hypothetical protein